MQNNEVELLFETKVNNYVRRHVLIQSDQQEGSNKKIFFLKVFATGLGSLAGIPFVKAGYNAAGNIPVLGYFFGLGTLVANGAGAIWVLHDIIEHLRPVSDEENILFPSTSTDKIKRAISFSLACLTTLIPLYMTYKFNDVKALALITIPISLAFNIFAYKTMLNNLSVSNFKKLKRNFIAYVCCNQTPADYNVLCVSHLIQPTSYLVHNLDYSELITLNKELFSDCNNLDDLLRVLGLHKRSVMKIESRATPLIQMLSMVFPIGMAFVNEALSAEMARTVYDNSAFIVCFVALLLTPAFSIDSYITLISVNEIMTALLNKLHGGEEMEYATKRYPNLTKVLHVASFSIAALSSSNRGYIAYETIKGSAKIFFTISTIVSSFIFETYALTTLHQKLLRYYIEKYGSEEEKLVTCIQNRLCRLGSLFLKMDNQQLKLLIKEEGIEFANDLEKNVEEDSLEITEVEEVNVPRLSFSNHITNMFSFFSYRRVSEPESTSTSMSGQYRCAIV